MDSACPLGTLLSEDGNSFCMLSVDQSQSICKVMGDLSLNDLGNGVIGLLHIQDNELTSVSTQLSEKNDNESFENDTCEDFHQRDLGIATAEKFLNKCATFPAFGKNTFSIALTDVVDEVGKDKKEDESGEDGLTTTEVMVANPHAKSAISPYSRSVSMPTPLKLVSAMKGSREKQGLRPDKLTVTWAPDVYDPIPTAVSHVATNKNQRHRSDGKRNKKNKQKGGGKSSRGCKAKDKKQQQQPRKYYSGCSNRSFESPEDDRAINCGELKNDSLGFDVGCPDPFCGHSFLKKSVATMHFSVAEAT